MAKYKNYGDVITDDLTKLSPEEKREQAKEFAEGSKELEEILVFLWEKGIQTIACCSGHEGKRYPYLSFYADKIDDKTLRKILTGLYSQQDVFISRTAAGEYDRPINIDWTLKKDKNASFEESLKSIKDAFNKEKSADEFKEKYNKLPQDKKDLIEASISIKSLGKMDNLIISDMKEYYPGLPKNVQWTETRIGWNEHGKIGYGLQFWFKRIKGQHTEEFEHRSLDGTIRKFTNKIEGYSHYYTRCKDDKCFIIDEKTKQPIYMTEEEARNKGFVSEKEFKDHMRKTLPNDKKFFDKIKEAALEKSIKTEQESEFRDEYFDN